MSFDMFVEFQDFASKISKKNSNVILMQTIHKHCLTRIFNHNLHQVIDAIEVTQQMVQQFDFLISLIEVVLQYICLHSLHGLYSFAMCCADRVNV